jgi:hypothetical protein
MDFLQKHFNGVFELPLPRNAQKRTLKKKKKKKSRVVVVGQCQGVWDLADVRGGGRPSKKKMRRPLEGRPKGRPRKKKKTGGTYLPTFFEIF